MMMCLGRPVASSLFELRRRQEAKYQEEIARKPLHPRRQARGRRAQGFEANAAAAAKSDAEKQVAEAEEAPAEREALRSAAAVAVAAADADAAATATSSRREAPHGRWNQQASVGSWLAMRFVGEEKAAAALPVLWNQQASVGSWLAIRCHGKAAAVVAARPVQDIEQLPVLLSQLGRLVEGDKGADEEKAQPRCGCGAPPPALPPPAFAPPPPPKAREALLCTTATASITKEFYNGQLVAVKTLRAEEAEPELAALRKAEHPNVLRLLHSFTAEPAEDGTERTSIVLEFVSGGNLLARIEEKEKMRLESVVAYAVCLLRAFAHISSHGVCHGDVWAANVLLKDDSRCVLADFGATCRSGAVRRKDLTRRTSWPPEWSDQPLPTIEYHFRHDWFGCGMVLDEMTRRLEEEEAEAASWMHLDLREESPQKRAHPRKILCGHRMKALFENLSEQLPDDVVVLRKDEVARLSAPQKRAYEELLAIHNTLSYRAPDFLSDCCSDATMCEGDSEVDDDSGRSID
eukprot:TRINITY_DN12636_c0_g1_i2.p1 TRINITY_DN12636_c0_g1~~TRINITY_DN12636_c0_g1_i2.p1  ORF type:complete len:519 (-),score=131.41 TRINITY_DN12636_c0_g1_i2:70-1626(-)